MRETGGLWLIWMARFIGVVLVEIGYNINRILELITIRVILLPIKPFLILLVDAVL